MTFAGIVGLLVFIYMRPPEFIEALEPIPFLYIFLFVVLVGFGLDLGARRTRLLPSPQLRIVLVFWVWCILGLLIRRPDVVLVQGINISVAVTLYMVVAHGIQTVQTFIKTTLTIFALGLFVAFIAAHQGRQPFTCVEIVPNTNATKGIITDIPCPMIGPDGEPIEGAVKCYEEGKEGRAYLCEKGGLLGTFSIVGRVRYLGVLQDPNEVALATSIAVPFAFSFLEQKRTFFRLALLIITLIIVGSAVVDTQSRGGQLVFCSVLGAYFIKKYGIKRGLIVAGVMAVPLIAFGGRSGEEAEQSELERLMAAAAGIKMMLQYPITGVGLAGFLDHHNLTAHNAYVLAAGELGFPGMCIFATMLVISIKIPVAVLQHELHDDPEVEKVKSLAMAMLAAFSGMVIGIFFLSWTYHYVLWIHFGLSGALYSVIKAKDPRFEVRLTKRDIQMAVGACVVLLIALTIQTKRKGAW